MALLPSAGSENTVGVLITTTADDGAIKTTQAELTVLGDTAAQAGAKAKSGIQQFSDTLSKAGQQMIDTGRSMSTYVSLPIIGIGAAAIKSATTFQQAMTYIRTDAGDTTDNINTLSTAVLNLAQNSQFDATDLANGLYHIASLGLRGTAALNALNTAQQMAAVGGSDLESTATALGGAIVTGIKGVQDYSAAAGVLDATIGAGNMRMQDLVNAIGTGVLPVFKNAGLSITDFGAALATLTDNGQDAAAAATHLRMTISLMEAPSAAARKELEAIGMTSDQLGMDMQTKGLIPALEDLQQHLIDTYGTTAEGKQKMAAALTEMFGGGRSSSAIQTLLDQLDRVQNKESQIGQQTSEFSKKVLEQAATPAAQLKIASDAMNADLIRLGSNLLPMVVAGVHNLSNAVNVVSNWFEHLSSGQKQFVVDAAAILAISGPLLMFFGGVAKGISSIIELATGPFGMAMRAMATAALNAADTIIASQTGGMGIIASAKLLIAYVGGPAVIAGWAAFGAAAVAAFVLIQKSANDTKNVIDQMQRGINADFNSINNAIQQVQKLATSGTPEQQARAKALLQSGALSADANAPQSNSGNPFSDFMAGLHSIGFATGTNYAPGGWSIVGENGPEAMYVPQGSMVKTNSQLGGLRSSNPGGNGITINQTNEIYNEVDLTEANRRLAWQLSNAI